MASGTLSGIYVYPIKSCRAVALDTVTVVAIGLLGDRTWQVVDEERRGVTQRQHRVLATVQPALLSGGGMRLESPSMPAIEVDPPGDETMTVKSHFGLPVPASDAGDRAAAWFSELTGNSVRLVAMVDACGWRLPDDLDVFGQNAPFSDAAPRPSSPPFGRSSGCARASEDFGMDRFRPNLVVSGTDPWDEDTWASFTIGKAELRGVLPWLRCAIPQIDQVTADRHTEPARFSVDTVGVPKPRPHRPVPRNHPRQQPVRHRLFDRTTRCHDPHRRRRQCVHHGAGRPADGLRVRPRFSAAVCAFFAHVAAEIAQGSHRCQTGRYRFSAHRPVAARRADHQDPLRCHRGLSWRPRENQRRGGETVVSGEGGRSRGSTRQPARTDRRRHQGHHQARRCRDRRRVLRRSQPAPTRTRRGSPPVRA